MRAKAISKDDPDVVESASPVADTSAVKSRILDLVGQLVEPGIEGVQAIEVNAPPGSKSGFVVVYIPASERFPRRSRKDWKFYLRIGSGTFPMEYFQIADMFGQRPKPNLELYLEYEKAESFPGVQNSFHQSWWIGLSNVGRGIAKFPALRFKKYGFALHRDGVDGSGQTALPLRPSERDWIVFRGGGDDVIFPETTLKIGRLHRQFNSINPLYDRWVFLPFTFSAEISCEGAPIKVIEKEIKEQHLNR